MLAPGDIVSLSRAQGLRGVVCEVRPDSYLVSGPNGEVSVACGDVVGRLHDGSVCSLDSSRDMLVFLDKAGESSLSGGKLVGRGLRYNSVGKIAQMDFSLVIDDSLACRMGSQVTVDFLDDGTKAVSISSGQYANLLSSGKTMQARYDGSGSKIDIYTESGWLADRFGSGTQETIALYLANWDSLDSRVKIAEIS